MQMSPSQLVSASQKHMFKSPPDGQGEGGGKSPCPGPGAAQRKLLSQELFNKQMGGGKEGQGTEKIRVRCICVSVCRCGYMGVPGERVGSANEITV